jgi:hypothetical protein
MLSLTYMLCMLEICKASSFWWLMRDRYEAAVREEARGVRQRSWSW